MLLIDSTPPTTKTENSGFRNISSTYLCRRIARCVLCVMCVVCTFPSSSRKSAINVDMILTLLYYSRKLVCGGVVCYLACTVTATSHVARNTPVEAQTPHRDAKTYNFANGCKELTLIQYLPNYLVLASRQLILSQLTDLLTTTTVGGNGGNGGVRPERVTGRRKRSWCS